MRVTPQMRRNGDVSALGRWADVTLKSCMAGTFASVLPANLDAIEGPGDDDFSPQSVAASHSLFSMSCDSKQREPEARFI